jgi:hypothetical protein
LADFRDNIAVPMIVALTPSGLLHRISYRHVMWFVVLAISSQACALLDPRSKVRNIPGLEEAELRDRMKKDHASDGQGGRVSQLHATPSAIAFGDVPVASTTQRAVVVSNPATFPVTIIHASVQGGCGFAMSNDPGNGSIVAAHGDITFTITFLPTQRRACSGSLLLEIDSAGGRFMRVPIEGRGV